MRFNGGKALLYIFLISFGFLSIFPFFWMISTSFKQTNVLFTIPPEFFPRKPTLINYVDLMRRSDFPIWFKNSVIVTVIATSFSMYFNSMAGYAFAKKRFPGRDGLFMLVLGMLMVPGQVILVPMFLIISRFNWVNTYQALILPLCAGPFGIFLMKQYMETLPNELLDAARIDGCSEFRIFSTIVLPLCRPALAALGVFAFLGSWNDFLWPLIATTTSTMRTLQVGLAVFQSQFQTSWGLV
ncbi:MAG TPA: carbohydrate ABC transporter permease, partial [Firmicutes bacterium]|nr:carbohydrate ABC transporter permease [Bacillota bacterium]